MTAAQSDATTSPGSSARSMRLFIFARHAESALNASGLLGSDPSRPIGLTPVVHELAIRYIVEAAAGANTLGLSEMRIANATPYLLDETALRTAAERLDALASPAPRTESRTEVAASTRPVKTKDFLDSTHPGGFAEQRHLADSDARSFSRRERLVLRRQDRDRGVNLEGGGNEHN